jgi:hypothetical protein
MKYFYALLLALSTTYIIAQGPPPPPPPAATCSNLDFSAGNYSNWVGQWNNAGSAMNETDPTSGQIYGYGALTVNGIDSNRFNVMGYVHEFCNGGRDPNVPINRVAPGHPFSVRLGDDSAYKAAIENSGIYPFNHQTISNTYSVTNTNLAITYWYAVVLDQSGVSPHPATEQPYFSIRMYDSSKHEITCARYDVSVAGAASVGGFQTKYDTTGTYQFFYKDWTSVSVSLSQYVGQKVTVQFETSDCDKGAHFGYAYVFADCGNIDTTQYVLNCTTADIDKYTSANKTNIYPNPSNGDINITSTNNITYLKITDILGQTVYEVKPNTESTTVQINKAGVYFVTTTIGREVSTKKVIVYK